MANRKLKLLIVDDEELMHDLLKFSLDWEEMDIELAGEAFCAEEAAVMVEELVPDIIISDVCMPLTDGVEFSRKVIQKYPYIKIIILTGHDRFDYAARSIEAGVSAFLLKPLDENEMTKAINKIKDTIYMEQSLKKEHELLRQYLSENQKYLQEKCLNALISHQSNLKEIIKKSEYLGIQLEGDFYELAVLELAPDPDYEGDREEVQLLLDVECRYFLTLNDQCIYILYIFYVIIHRISILSFQRVLYLNDCFNDIKNLILNKFQCDLTIGIGDPAAAPSGIYTSYHNACQALKYKVIVGNNQVINYSDVVFHTPDPSAVFTADYTEDLSVSLKSGQKKTAFSIIDQCFHNRNIGMAGDILSIRVIATNLIGCMIKIIMESGLEKDNIFQLGMKAYERTFRLETVEEIKNTVKNLAWAIMETIEKLISKKSHSLANQVKDYLNKNYADSSLSLSGVARIFYVNSSYLSRIFKNETGSTFVEYLTGIRIQMAMELMYHTDKRFYEIGMQVGISDPKYFGICFKKYAGITANEYRKKLEQE